MKTTWHILVSMVIISSFFNEEKKLDSPMPEICENAIDDDMDGLIDLNDPDCACALYEPKSLIPNPSFEDLECCPTDRSQLNCATGWIQASQATTDLVHTCDWLGWAGLEPTLPFPDGNGAAGFRNGRFSGPDAQYHWKEYMGACLLSPLKARNVYRFQFYIGYTYENNSPTTQLVFFGATKCDSLPFGIGNPNHGCPTNGDGKGWVALDSVEIGGVESWELKEVTLRPRENINAIAIGPSCQEFVWDYPNYYFLDKLVLAEEIEFEYRIGASGSPCLDNVVLSVPPIFSTDYQWYKNGIALVGETSNELKVTTGEGDYVVRIDGDGSCQVTPPFILRTPEEYSFPYVTICEGESYFLGEEELTIPGTYSRTITAANGCDSIVLLDLKVLGVRPDTIQGKIFNGESYKVGNSSFDRPGEYTVNLQSSLGCDSIIVLQLDYFEVFAPNAFSPNGDGINDYFTIQGGNELDRIIDLKVFDRWGNLVYQGQNLNPGGNEGWNGRIRGQKAPSGIYIYIAMLGISDGTEKKISGELILIN